MRHVIGRQVIEFEVDRSSDAVQLQQDVREIYDRRVLPAIDRVLDRHSEPATTIRCERLELDLGRLDASSLEEDLAERVAEALDAQIGSLLAGREAETTPGRSRLLELWRFVIAHGRLPWWADKQSADDLEGALVGLLEHAERLPRVILQLLRAQQDAIRRLAWQSASPLFWLVLKRTDPALAELLSPLRNTVDDLPKSSAVQRILCLLRESMLTEAVRPTRQDSQARVARVIERTLESCDVETSRGDLMLVMEALVGTLALKQAERTALFARLNRQVVPDARTSGEEPPSGRPIASESRPSRRDADRETSPSVDANEDSQAGAGPSSERLFEYEELDVGPRDNVHPTDAQAPEQMPPERREQPSLPQRDPEPLSDAPPWDGNAEAARPLEPAADELEPRRSKAAIGQAAGEHSQVSTNAAIRSQRGERKQGTPPRADAKTLAPGEFIYVADAGVILLHPYLRSHFEKLKLCRDGEFLDASCRELAVHQLRLLASGQTSSLEYNLVLPKLICGMRPEEPVARDVPLGDEFHAEADALLTAVVKHWGALGSSSPDGLREGFLRREGRLEHSADGWRLTVESKTIDVLLGRLPWTISMVKLPWMADLLRVDWI